MELMWIAVIGAYVYSIYVCFQKGKPGFAWTGVAGLFPFFTPFLAWFPIVGALRPAMPGSPWILEREPEGTDKAYMSAPPPVVPEQGPMPGPTGVPSPHGAIPQFLDRAVAAGVIPDDVRTRLLDFHWAPPTPVREPNREEHPNPATEFLTRRPGPARPPATRPPTDDRRPAPEPVSTSAPSRQPEPQPARPPSPLQRRMSRVVESATELWDAASSDIALHGLAYLGVLLTFIGILGFLLFAFQDVPNSAQPLVEGFIAIVFFGWAWVLRRQGVSTVANALELIGGMTLPLILFAGFVDEAPIPPDATGGVLIATMTITALVLGAGFAAVARRRPDSMLRFLVAPMVWLAVLALGFVFKTDEPLRGIAITKLVSGQAALAAIAVAAVLVAVGRGALPGYGRSAMLAGFVGIPAAYALALGLATAESWRHPETGVVAGLATIASVHAVARYFDRTRLAMLATPVLLAGAIAPLIELTGLAWGGVVAAIAYLVVIERTAGNEEADQIVWIMAATGTAIGLAMALGDGPATVVGFTAVSLWAHGRRVTGLGIAGSSNVLAAAAAVLPIGIGWGIWTLLAPESALLLMAAIVFTVAVTVRLTRSTDMFWSVWPLANALIIAAPTTYVSLLTTALAPGSRHGPAFTLALTAGTVMLGRDWQELRVWLATAISIVAAMSYIEFPWAGALTAVAYLAILEWTAGRDEPNELTWVASVVACGLGLGMTLATAPAVVVGFGAASLWAHRRRLVGSPFDHHTGGGLTAAAALLPIGVGWGVWNLMAHYPALALMAAVVAGIALATRRLDPQDVFWSLWPPALALIVGGLATEQVFRSVSGEGPEALAPVTLLLVAATIAAGRRWPELRLWLASGSAATAVALGLEGATASPEMRALVWASTGLAAVALAGLTRRTLADHLAVVGHITVSGALLITVNAGTFAILMWAWTLSWLLSLIAGTGRRGSLTRLLKRSPGNANALQWIVPALFASSVPIAVIAAANLWPEFVAHRAWTGDALGLLAVAYATATRRLASGGPLRRVLAIGAVAMAVMGVAIAAPAPWATILATGSTMVTALVLAGDDRQTAFSWFAWLMSGVMAVLLAERAGVAPRHLYLVSLGWGVALLLGGLIADDIVAGRRERGEGLRARWARYPVFVGALAVPVSLAPVFARDARLLGWSSAAAAIGYFVVAALLRAGLASAPGYALMSVAAVALSPWSILEDPALLPAVAGVLVVVAMVAGRIQPAAVSGDVWLSWEIAPLLVAHVVGAAGLAVAHNTATPEVTWFLLGVISAAIALWRRRGLWVDASIVMFIVGAWYVGLGALALALAIMSLRAMVGVYLSDGDRRTPFHVVAVGAAAASWLIVLAWQGWDMAQAASHSALLFGFGSLAVAAALRRRLVKRDSAIVWGALTAAGVTATGFTAGAAEFTHATGTGEAGIAGLGVAIGLAAFALALELAAERLEPVLRYWAVVMAGASWAATLVGTATSVNDGIVLTSIAGGALALIVVEMTRRSAASLTIAQAWALLGAASVLIATLSAFLTIANNSTWQFGIATGLALLTAAAARGARPLNTPVLREASGLIGLAALASFLYGSGVGATGFATAMLIVAAGATVAILQVAGRREDAVWLPALQWLAVGANLTAAGFAISTAPQRSLIATVLLAGGIQSIAIGIGLERLALLAAGPPAIGVAFVLTVAEAVSGSVQWYTTPLALVILTEVEVVRLHRGGDSQLLTTQQLAALEWSGIALITVPAIVEMFFRGPFAGLLLFLVAALLLLWAILTRIRRRAVAAAAVAAGSAVMMASSALTLQVPDSAGFWIIAVGLGFAAMSIAGVIEASRSRQGRLVRRFDQLMDGWA